MLASDIDKFVREETVKAQRRGGVVRLDNDEIARVFPNTSGIVEDEIYIRAICSKMVRLCVLMENDKITLSEALDLIGSYILMCQELCSKFGFEWDRGAMNRNCQDRINVLKRTKVSGWSR